MHFQRRITKTITQFTLQNFMDKILFIIQKNPILSKYGLGIVTLFMMIISIKTYLNYLAIETSIENVNNQTLQVTQRKNYEENFLIAYEQSEYAKYFLLHENNILLPWEFIIRFEHQKNTQTLSWEVLWNTLQTPQDSRQHFFGIIQDKYK